MENMKTFEDATASAKKEMADTLYQVAKMRAHFELLKQAIINNIGLNYSGDELTIKNDGVIIEVMYLIENDEMENLFTYLKAEHDAKKAQEEKSNG